MKNYLILLLCLCFYSTTFAQQKPIEQLEVVYLENNPLRDSVYTSNQLILNDSILKRSQASLTQLLNFNSTIYFKENGLGMVASPSFRGTTAQQTAVLWNGISINSQTTGQTDFNTVTTRGYDKVTVKPGGGSVVDGSNSIGGSIYLENEIPYNHNFENNVFMQYGSFNTYGLHVKSSYSNKKTGISVGLSKNASDNDYKYPKTGVKNKNGHYKNTNISLAAGTKLNKQHELQWFANIYDSRRNFSLPNPYALPNKYYDFNTRSLLNWKYHKRRFSSSAKVAVLTDRYTYYPNVNYWYHSKAKVETYLFKYDADYRLSKNMLLTGGLNLTRNQGSGTNFSQSERHIGAAALGFKHQATPSFIYEIMLRQEVNEHFDSPFLYRIGLQKEFSEVYTLKFNTSKNYRIPTYNDLYWNGLGNPDLKPETSYGVEISNLFSYKKYSLNLTAYYNKIEDLLRWTPSASGIWRPENTNNVQTYGLEAILSLTQSLWDKHFVNFNATYAYTISENTETKKQLIYVPKHKLTWSLSYAYKKINAYYQYINTGEVFHTTDNSKYYTIGSYMVGNLGLEYKLKQQLTIGVQALNVWNEKYESVLNRPMPGRNYTIYLNLNI